MACSRSRAVLAIVAAIGLLAGTASAVPLVGENFQIPLYANNTDDPSFPGWSFTYNNPQHLNSRLSAATPGGTSDFPGANGNQGIQFEWTNVEGSYTVSAPSWNTGDVFELTVDVAPQSWNGANDRYFAPSLIQGGSTIWSANTLMDKWSGSPIWEQKQYYIPTTGFTPGTDVTLHLDHTGQRGLYLDNVNLSVDAAPVDNDPPLPSPPQWKTVPTVFDYTSAFMSVSPASDPYGVEYRFTNATTGNNSGWQDSTQWVDSGLDQNANYDYQAIARDKSPSQNPTSAATDSATTGGLEGLIFSSGFEYPEYPNNTANPDFVGWVWTKAGSVKSRTNSSDGLPGGADNQAVQFEYNDAFGTRPTDHGWSDEEIYTVLLNVAPQQWNGGTQRYFQVTLLEGDGTELWGSGDVAIPLYNNFGGDPWPSELFFSFDIDGTLFGAIPGAVEGSPLSLKVAHPTGQRGIYVDNVMLTFAGPDQPDVIPEPATLSLLGLGALLALRRRRRSPVRRTRERNPRRAGMKTRRAIAVLLGVGLFLGLAGAANAGLIGNWVADDWTGSGDWLDRVSSLVAAPNGDPVVVDNSFNTLGAIDGIDLDGNDNFRVTAANNPAAGKKFFTVVAMFKTTTGGANDDTGGNWWKNSGIVGGEVSANPNDWGLMLLEDGRANLAFCKSSMQGGNVIDGVIHTAMITWSDDDFGGDSIARFYLDGSYIGQATQDGGNGIANNGFSIGRGYLDGGAYYTGQIGAVRMYDSIEDAAAVHSELTADIIPEPATLSLLGLGALLALRRRRRQ